MTCPGCKAEFDEFRHEARYNKALDIAVCEECDDRIERHHLIDGRYTVHKCKECGHITKVEWVPYKKRGRPTGSKSKSTEKEEKAQEHISKWTGELGTLEEFVPG